VDVRRRSSALSLWPTPHHACFSSLLNLLDAACHVMNRKTQPAEYNHWQCCHPVKSLPHWRKSPSSRPSATTSAVLWHLITSETHHPYAMARSTGRSPARSSSGDRRRAGRANLERRPTCILERNRDRCTRAHLSPRSCLSHKASCRIAETKLTGSTGGNVILPGDANLATRTR
jgi:hypothetical protein